MTYNHCLNHLVSMRSLTWLQEYGYAQAGLFPEPGGLNDQYEIDLEALALIAQIDSEDRDGKKRHHR